MMNVPLTERSLDRILDANLNRAREGIRVIEEWCRFSLENQTLTALCKSWRQTLGHWHSLDLRLARNTPDDPGTVLTHPQEEHRESTQAVLQANLCRVQEALRVLEEYGKVSRPDMAAACKQMRYQVYTLEREIMTHPRLQKLLNAQLYLVTSPSDRLIEIVESALQGGVQIVQYRDKQADDGMRLRNAHALSELCHRYDALFIVNDRPDIALLVGADGVHVGQQDLPVTAVRQLVGADAIIGCSTTNPDEMQMALDAKPDYIGVGPVYETPTKAGKKAAGLAYVKYAVDQAPLPWFAIGGIDAQNLPDVMAAGCDRVAVVRAVMDAEDPAHMSRQLRSQLKHL
jgi:thiamine-phosphate pyrophosphorylase